MAGGSTGGAGSWQLPDAQTLPVTQSLSSAQGLAQAPARQTWAPQEVGLPLSAQAPAPLQAWGWTELLLQVAAQVVSLPRSWQPPVPLHLPF